MDIKKFIDLLGSAHEKKLKVKIRMLSGTEYEDAVDIQDYVEWRRADYTKREIFNYVITDNTNNGDVILKNLPNLKTEVHFNAVDVSEVQLSEYSFIDKSDKYIRVRKEYSSDVVPFAPICMGL
jgi:hypothetical protein